MCFPKKHCRFPLTKFFSEFGMFYFNKLLDLLLFFPFSTFNMIHKLLKFHLAEVNIQSDSTLDKELKFKLAMSRSFNTAKEQVLPSD